MARNGVERTALRDRAPVRADRPLLDVADHRAQAVAVRLLHVVDVVQEAHTVVDLRVAQVVVEALAGVPEREAPVGKVREATAPRLVAVPRRIAGRARARGLFPLAFRRQTERPPRLPREPGAVRLRLGERHAHHGQLRHVERDPAVLVVLADHVVEAVAVVRRKRPVRLERQLRLGEQHAGRRLVEGHRPPARQRHRDRPPRARPRGRPGGRARRGGARAGGRHEGNGLQVARRVREAVGIAFGIAERVPPPLVEPFARAAARMRKEELPPLLRARRVLRPRPHAPVAPIAVAPVVDEVRPRAPERRVEVDPRVERAPLVVRQAHAVVARLQQLHERRRAGVVLAGVEEVVVGLRARPPHVALEVPVAAREGAGCRELGLRLLVHLAVEQGRRTDVRQIRLRRREEGRLFLRRVDPDAVGVRAPRKARLLRLRDGIGVVRMAARAAADEDRLHLAQETPGPRLRKPRHRRDLRGRALDDRHVRRARVGVLVAAEAGDVFARHADEPATHELHGAPLRVERLDGDRRVDGGGEEDRPPLVHGRRAKHVLRVPARLHAHALVRGRVVEAVVVGEEAHALDRAARHVLQAGALVDVAHVNRAVAHVFAAGVGQDGRALPRAPGDRLRPLRPLLLHEQRHVVEDVHEVDAPQRGLGRLHRAEEVFSRAVLRRRAERVRGERRRVVALVEAVHHAVLRRLPPARHELHAAGGLGARAVRVEQRDLPGLRRVVPRRDADELPVVARDRERAAEVVRPIAVRAVEAHLARAVRAHRHDNAREIVRDVAVFPPHVLDAPVVQHARVPVRVLVVREAHDRLRRRIEAVHVRHAPAPGLAREALFGGVGREDDLVVRQIAAVVRFVGEGVRQQRRPRPRPEVGLVEPPDVRVRRDVREDGAPGVPVQIHGVDRAAAGRIEEDRLGHRLVGEARERDDLRVVPLRRVEPVVAREPGRGGMLVAARVRRVHDVLEGEDA